MDWTDAAMGWRGGKRRGARGAVGRLNYCFWHSAEEQGEGTSIGNKFGKEAEKTMAEER